MPFNGVFVRIEEFSEAYESRIEDFILVAKENRRKTLSMYLGGVVIECFLKKLLVQKYNIAGRKGIKYWYDLNIIEELSEKDNVLKEEYKEKRIMDNPYHDYSKALELLGLSDNLPENIENKIKLVYNPLKQEKTDFTDLRYRAEKDIETEEFEEWLASFREVHNWINDQKQRIED